MTGVGYVKISELLAKRVDTPATIGVAGEGVALQVDSLGRLWVHIAGDTRMVKVLSSSTDGRPITIGTGSTNIHTVSATAGTVEQVWLYLSNTTASSVVVTISFGGVSTSDEMPFTIEAEETILAVAGSALQNGLVISATAPALGINVSGYAEELT